MILLICNNRIGQNGTYRTVACCEQFVVVKIKLISDNRKETSVFNCFFIRANRRTVHRHFILYEGRIHHVSVVLFVQHQIIAA